MFSIFLVTGLLFASGDVVGTNAVNHIANPGFEEGMAPWVYEGPEYTIEAGAGRNGGAALRFENTNTNFYHFPRQRVNLRPGRAYRYEYWLKTELSYRDGRGANCCIEWNDEKGKFLGGAYNQGGKSGTHDWTKIVSTTPRIPLNATNIRISPLVSGGVVGRCWFDDFVLTEVPPRPVGDLSVSAYRGLVSEGQVRIAVALELFQEDFPDLGALEWRFFRRDAEGRMFAIETEVFTRDQAEASFDASSLAEGKHTIVFTLADETGAEVGRAETVIEKVATLPKLRVMFDQHGRTLVDGEKFFPLGMYWANPLTEEDLDLYAKGPFNSIMPYVRINRETLDRCQARGLKCCCNFIHDSLGESGQRARALIAELKGHPAFLAWYVNDEKTAAEIPFLTRRYDMLLENDPDHPTWAVEDKPDEVRLFMKTFDVIGTDPYPLGRRPLSMAADWARRTRRSVFGMRPMWMVPQAFDPAAYSYLRRKGRANLAPTAEQISAMTWMTIAEGANGIFLYSFHDLKKEVNVPFAESWRDVCTAAEEVRQAIPILLMDPAPVPAPAPYGVSVRAWRDEATVYVLAVNATDEEKTFAPFPGDAVRTLAPWSHQIFNSKEVTMKNPKTNLSTALAIALAAQASPAAALDGRATAQERITAENARVGSLSKTWSGSAWRNERVHATFVVWGEPGARLELKAGALAGPDGAVIADVRARQVLESLADDWVMGCPKDWSKFPSRPVGEALDDTLPVTLNDRGFRAIWVTVKTPVDAPVGRYRGGLEVVSGGERLDLAIDLSVLPMTLPAKRKMYLDIWQTPWSVARYYKVEPFSDEHFARLEPIYRELADAGQRAITLTMTDFAWNIRRNIDTARSMIEYTKGKDGEFRADFSLLDRYVEFCKKCGLGPDLHFYALARFQGNTSYWYWGERETYRHIDCKTGSPEFIAYWTPLLKQLEAHAEEKGWRGHVYVALDECSREEVQACADLLASAAPSFKFQMAGDRSPSAFEGIHIDNYSQKLSAKQVDAAFLAEVPRRREQGFTTTCYVCCSPRKPNCLVLSPLHEARWIGIYLATKGFDGFLKSTSHRWMSHVDPLVDTNCRPHFPCGDSFLLYPGPRSSVRWESLRDGWEDYDKLVVLREAGRLTPALNEALEKIDLQRFSTSDEATVLADIQAVYDALEAASR